MELGEEICFDNHCQFGIRCHESVQIYSIERHDHVQFESWSCYLWRFIDWEGWIYLSHYCDFKIEKNSLIICLLILYLLSLYIDQNDFQWDRNHELSTFSIHAWDESSSTQFLMITSFSLFLRNLSSISRIVYIDLNQALHQSIHQASSS